jgi:hypothetical protein
MAVFATVVCWFSLDRAQSQQNPALPRRLRVERLEQRTLLSNFGSVPLWDGERVDGTGGQTMLNYFGGGLGASSGATVSYTTAVVHSGQGGYCINLSGSVAQGSFAFVQTTLGATGKPPPYMDTRDLTPYQYISCWINNQTGVPFTVQLNIQDYHADSGHQALWSQVVPSKSGWMQIEAPLDLKVWTVSATPPDLTRARLLGFVIVANRGSAVSGKVYLDDVDLIEPGGAVDPAQTSPEVLAQRLAKREFDALWGTRDPNTGLLPAISSFEDVTALNVTAALLKSLPNAVAQGWISSSAADGYVAQVVQTLGTILNQDTYLPARYVDRVSLQPDYDIEVSSADAAYMYLALYQYEWLSGTSAALRTNIGQLLARFNFKPFATSQGWLMSYDPAGKTFSTGIYDEYSGEIWLISLAADLAGQVDINALWNSGINRLAIPTLDNKSSYIVGSSPDNRSPFMQWLFPMFVNVCGLGSDDYPVPALACNPLDNATTYQTDVDARLAAEGRSTMLQPDAGDDYTGTHYHAYSAWDDFKQSTLFMPWSDSLALLGDPSAAGTALQQLLVSGLQGPFGLVDSAFWTTGDLSPVNVAARNDLWNTSLSLTALDQYLYQDNQYLTSAPAVGSALAEVFRGALNLTGTSFSFTGGLTPATWTILVNGSKVTSIPATTTAVIFTGIGSSATATITGASASGESAVISPGQATFNGVGTSGPYTVTATNLFSATVTSGGSGALSVTDATGGNTLTELPTLTTLASSGNSASQIVANGFNNVLATATAAGSSTVASLFGSSAADTFTANPQTAVMQDTAKTSYRLQADGFTTVRGNGGAGGDTALLTDAAGGTFNATSTTTTLTGTGYNIIANNFKSVQATAVGPADAATLRAGPGTNVFVGSKGKSEFEGVNYNNVANGFFTVNAYGAAGGYNTALLTDSAGNATATLKPQTATLSDAPAGPASYQINLASGFQMIQVFETSLVRNSTAILQGSSTAANSFTSTSTDATLVPSAGNTYREYVRGFTTVQATATYANDTANLYDSPGNDTFTATPAGATMSLAGGKTVVAAGFKTVNAYSRYGGTDTANLTGTAGSDAASLWSTSTLMKMSTGSTVRAWYFARYNLDGGGGSGDTVTTMDAAVLPTKQTTVAGAKVIAWLADFAEINEDYSPGSQNTNKSYAIAVDQVLTAYWS